MYYCIDNEFNFYFISQLDSLHTKNLLANPTVSFAIFDSQQKEGTGNGVQASGKAYLLSDNDIVEALKWYKTTYIEMNPESFKKPSLYRIFKIIPNHFYTQDPEATVDKRVEVVLT